MTRAGNNIRANKATPDDINVINDWRAAHRRVINSFQAILRNRTRGTDIIVAQRHKRKRTIVDKLNRYPKMQLGRMDDVAGCRLIFPNIEELHTFRDKLHESRFNHILKNQKDKYDYIANPKPTGYRGIHDVYEYNVSSDAGSHLKGLLIELQYRTKYQHAWATANEVIGFLTESQPKFERGDDRYLRIMQLTSEIISRAFEGLNSSLPNVCNKEIVREFHDLDKDIHLMQMLYGLNVVNPTIANKKNFILIFEVDENNDEMLDIRNFKSTTDALHALFELEAKDADTDIVLVLGDSPDDVRESFKNYFSDATHFVELVEKGCKMLLA